MEKGVVESFCNVWVLWHDCVCELPLVFLLDVCFRMLGQMGALLRCFDSILACVERGCVSEGLGRGVLCGIGLLTPNLASWLKIGIKLLHIYWPLELTIFRLELNQHIQNTLVV